MSRRPTALVLLAVFAAANIAAVAAPADTIKVTIKPLEDRVVVQSGGAATAMPPHP